ncbi:hypothetical protein ANRL4_01123 [Anaerolineae bacterium]|nr:hypothetical protein ANRL4_01123 [Anaerolineae bacterium]
MGTGCFVQRNAIMTSESHKIHKHNFWGDYDIYLDS